MTDQNEKPKLEVSVDVYELFRAYDRKSTFENCLTKAMNRSTNIRDNIAKAVQESMIKNETMQKISTNVHVATDKYFSKINLQEDYNFKQTLKALVREAVKDQQSKINEAVEDAFKNADLKELIENQIRAEISDRVGQLFGRFNDN